MTAKRQLLTISEDQREDFGKQLRALAKRVRDGELLCDDPKDGDPESGLAWLQKNGIGVEDGVKGVSIHFQTLENPCIMLPRYELLEEPLPPPGYDLPEFYEGHFKDGDPLDLSFYLKRLSDYTLTHCGGG